jgi:hypothetical protein
MKKIQTMIFKKMSNSKRIRLLVYLLPLTPFIVCLALPAMILSGDLKQAGKCAACRLMAAISKDDNIRLC